MPSLSGLLGVKPPQTLGALPPSAHHTRALPRAAATVQGAGLQGPSSGQTQSWGGPDPEGSQGLCEKEDQQERPQWHGGGCLHGRERPQDTSLLGRRRRRCLRQGERPQDASLLGCGLSLLLLGLCLTLQGKPLPVDGRSGCPLPRSRAVRAPCSEPAALLAQLRGCAGLWRAHWGPG